jgi:hypothetical protein
MSGAIGRTFEGVRLDTYLSEMRDRKLRRRAYRTCGHIDRDFQMCERMAAGEREWNRGYLYHWWGLEFERRFPTRRQKHVELCRLFEAYTDSIFDSDYKPQTKTQLAIRRAKLVLELDDYKKQMKKSYEEVGVAVCATLFFSLCWLLSSPGSMTPRFGFWYFFFNSLISLSGADDVYRSFEAWKKKNSVSYDDGGVRRPLQCVQEPSLESVPDFLSKNPDQAADSAANELQENQTAV